MLPRTPAAAALLLLPACLHAWNPDWYRETNPRADETIRGHEERARDLIDTARERGERDRREAERLSAMDPAARRLLLEEEFARWVEAWPGYGAGLESAFPTGALGLLRPEFPGDGSVLLRDESTGRERATLTTGDPLEIEYEDVSLVVMATGAIDGEAGRVEFLLGDGRWWLHEDGTVEPLSAGELTARHTELLSHWNPEGPLVNLHQDAMPFTATAALIIRRAGRDEERLRRVGVFPERSISQRLAARPMEMQLTLACLSYGTADGAGVVWEHDDGGGVLLRPFPVIDQAVNLLTPPHRLLSVSPDGSSADILVEGEVHDVMIFDYVPLPILGPGSAKGIVGSIDATIPEVIVDCAGRGVAFRRSWPPWMSLSPMRAASMSISAPCAGRRVWRSSSIPPSNRCLFAPHRARPPSVKPSTTSASVTAWRGGGATAQPSSLARRRLLVTPASAHPDAFLIGPSCPTSQSPFHRPAPRAGRRPFSFLRR